MSLVLDILSIIVICAGTFFFFAGTVGLLRFPDALTRLHALTKAVLTAYRSFDTMLEKVVLVLAVVGV
jgi:monovalent cation/proton antiporter MnhG/PhaG subunit